MPGTQLAKQYTAGMWNFGIEPMIIKGHLLPVIVEPEGGRV